MTCQCGRPIVRVRRYHVGIAGSDETLYGVEWRRQGRSLAWQGPSSIDTRRPGPLPELDGSGTHYHLHCSLWRDVGGASRHERKVWRRDLPAELAAVLDNSQHP